MREECWPSRLLSPENVRPAPCSSFLPPSVLRSVFLSVPLFVSASRSADLSLPGFVAQAPGLPASGVLSPFRVLTPSPALVPPTLLETHGLYLSGPRPLSGSLSPFVLVSVLACLSFLPG